MLNLIKNNKAFSLIELMIVIAIIGVLTMIAVPHYKPYIIKSRIMSFFPLADSYKLKITEKIANGETNNINNIIANPTKLIEQLETINANNKYIIKFTANMANLGLQAINNNPLIIKFIGEENPDTNLLSWVCEYSAGYAKVAPTVCQEAND